MPSWKTILRLTLLATLPALACGADSAPALLAAGRVDDAISTLQGEISASPNDADAHHLLCRAYFALGDWDRGIAACEKAVALDPNNGRYHLWLGRIYGEKADASSFFTAAGLAKKVRTEFERAVQLTPNSVDARTDLAEFYLEAPGIVGGGRDKAEAQARTLATLDPARAHWVTARIAEKKKDLAAAEKDYRAAIEASHGSADAWLNLALFFRHAGRLDDMEGAIVHATSAQIEQPVVLMDAAETLIRAGRNFPGATKLLKQYLSRSPVEEAPVFKAHYLLGTVLEKQGDRKAAAEEYRAALALAKDFTRAQEALNRVAR
jgi:tetratricopeptide (TPR) repeat protein